VGGAHLGLGDEAVYLYEIILYTRARARVRDAHLGLGDEVVDSVDEDVARDGRPGEECGPRPSIVLHVHMYVCMYVCIYVCMSIYLSIYIYTSSMCVWVWAWRAEMRNGGREREREWLKRD
jgi:hypothetical protein